MTAGRNQRQPAPGPAGLRRAGSHRPSRRAAPRRAPSRPTPPPAGGGITVPPLPPIPGPVDGRRPLSNEDFEEELDIPEFLKQ